MDYLNSITTNLFLQWFIVLYSIACLSSLIKLIPVMFEIPKVWESYKKEVNYVESRGLKIFVFVVTTFFTFFIHIFLWWLP